jgi:hypothetical protein
MEIDPETMHTALVVHYPARAASASDGEADSLGFNVSCNDCHPDIPSDEHSEKHEA